MLRSFDYARWRALRRVAQRAGRSSSAWRRWRGAGSEQAATAFLRAYDEAARGAGAVRVRSTPGRGLLGLFELEKALYELRYELANRPDWVQHPAARASLRMAADDADHERQEETRWKAST